MQEPCKSKSGRGTLKISPASKARRHCNTQNFSGDLRSPIFYSPLFTILHNFATQQYIYSVVIAVLLYILLHYLQIILLPLSIGVWISTTFIRSLSHYHACYFHATSTSKEHSGKQSCLFRLQGCFLDTSCSIGTIISSSSSSSSL